MQCFYELDRSCCLFECLTFEAAHMKASIFGSSVTIPITNGTFNLGTWQVILSKPAPKTFSFLVVNFSFFFCCSVYLTLVTLVFGWLFLFCSGWPGACWHTIISHLEPGNLFMWASKLWRYVTWKEFYEGNYTINFLFLFFFFYVYVHSCRMFHWTADPTRVCVLVGCGCWANGLRNKSYICKQLIGSRKLLITLQGAQSSSKTVWKSVHRFFRS